MDGPRVSRVIRPCCAVLLLAGLLLVATPLEAGKGPVTETELLRQAPRGAVRLTPQVLRVNWARGHHLFRNLPGDEFERRQWVYGGYVAGARVHLVRRLDGQDAQGVLLDHQTGKVLPGGNVIQFAKDWQVYLAISTQSGADVEDLELRRRDGRLIWRHPAAILAPDRQSIRAILTDVRLESDNRVSARASCPAPPIRSAVRVSYMRSTSGSWQWEPEIRCN